jgi:hypothetical protein
VGLKGVLEGVVALDDCEAELLHGEEEKEV